MCTHTGLHDNMYFEFITPLCLVSEILPIFRTYLNLKKNEVFISSLICCTSCAIPISCGLSVASLSKGLDPKEVDEEMEDRE